MQFGRLSQITNDISFYYFIDDDTEDDDGITGWKEGPIKVTRDMLEPSEAVKIGDHLFTLVVNEKVGKEQLSYVAVSTPHIAIGKTNHYTGRFLDNSADAPITRAALFTSIDPFTSGLEQTVKELRKSEKEDFSEQLCNSLSAIDIVRIANYK